MSFYPYFTTNFPEKQVPMEIFLSHTVKSVKKIERLLWVKSQLKGEVYDKKRDNDKIFTN